MSMTKLNQNTTDLQSLAVSTGYQEVLDLVDTLPDAGGVELPELSTPASEEEIFLGKEVIDETGSVRTGTFTIDSELSAQDDLIAQIQTALEGKAAGSGGAAVEYEIITIPAGATSVTYTLPRVTAAHGIMVELIELDGTLANIAMGISNSLCSVFSYVGGDTTLLDTSYVTYKNGTMLLYNCDVIVPIEVTLINDPNAEAIST